MSNQPGLIVAQAVPANAGLALLARIRSLSYALLTQASLSSIGYAVRDVTAGAQLAAGTFAVATVVYDQLQQGDPFWDKDSAAFPGGDGSYGYNFKAVLPASAIPVSAAGHQIQVDVVLTPTSGEQARVVFSFLTERVYA